MSFPGQFFTPAYHNIENERAWNDDDLIADGRNLVKQVQKNGVIGSEVAEKVKLFEGQASGSSKKVGTYGVPSEGSEERMNLDDPAPPRSLGPLKAKIRLKDYPNIRFSTTEVSRFLERFEAAADGEGAEDSDKVRQVVNFIQDEEVLRDVEDMDGYEKKDWAELKKEMLEKWGQSEQRYREADLDRLAAEVAEEGGVQTREQYGKYVSSFDRILKYLNRNGIVTGTPGAVKRTFIKAFPKEMRERALRQLYDRNLVNRSKDGGVIVLPDMKEIRKALQGEMDMQELVEDGIEARGSGTAKSKEPVTAKEVGELADTLKELRLFMQKTVTQSWKPSAGRAGADATPAAPEAATKGQGFVPRGPPACSYCGEVGHFKAQCADLTTDMKTLGVRPVMRDFYLDGEKIEAAVPRNEVRRRRSAETAAGGKGKEAEVKSHIGIVERGKAWTPPAVAAEVRAVAAEERVCFGERYDRMDLDQAPRAEPVPKKPKAREPAAQQSAERKRAGELARKALGNDTALSLTLKDLAAISPLMAEQLIGSIREAAGPSFKETAEKVSAPVETVLAEVRSAEFGENEKPVHRALVSCPLGYVEMEIRGQKVWAMIDSGSMINIMPAELARATNLARRKTSMSIRTMGGFRCEVEGVVEAEPVLVAKVEERILFLVTRSNEIILGRPFLFAFRTDLRFCPRRREEIMAVRDSGGRQFETTICQPQSGEWLNRVVDEERHGEWCHEPPAEDF
ncbi:hypothetical protein PGTUg99_020660 [Puccinia graminis f. sp. tritici]|uniref:CCHC-type domain-containing protein n=1 Tax=Puccinia graminis f. sp. tritici TaxID=56615 RepID=A0A5B0MCW3_PUCGR|nr:hypothetical protein PGTUg99_020660 [Puccinia graminis f. sp. tritici]